MLRPALLIVLTLVTPCMFAQTMPAGLQEVTQQFDRTATASIKNGSLSFALAVVTRNGPAWTRNYGGDAETPYRVGVAAFTGIMLLQLVRDGRVHLSDRVE